MMPSPTTSGRQLDGPAAPQISQATSGSLAPCSWSAPRRTARQARGRESASAAAISGSSGGVPASSRSLPGVRRRTVTSTPSSSRSRWRLSRRSASRSSPALCIAVANSACACAKRRSRTPSRRSTQRRRSAEREADRDDHHGGAQQQRVGAVVALALQQLLVVGVLGAEGVDRTLALSQRVVDRSVADRHRPDVGGARAARHWSAAARIRSSPSRAALVRAPLSSSAISVVELVAGGVVRLQERRLERRQVAAHADLLVEHRGQQLLGRLHRASNCSRVLRSSEPKTSSSATIQAAMQAGEEQPGEESVEAHHTGRSTAAGASLSEARRMARCRRLRSTRWMHRPRPSSSSWRTLTPTRRDAAEALLATDPRAPAGRRSRSG